MEQLTEEDFAFTLTEQEKINILRKQREVEVINKANYKPFERSFKKDMYVFVIIKSVTICGYIINEDNGLFDVSTPKGILYQISAANLKGRYVKDLSNIEIPQAVKDMTTNTLLNELQMSR